MADITTSVTRADTKDRIVVRVRGMRIAKFRMWLTGKIFRFGEWVGGVTVLFDDESE